MREGITGSQAAEELHYYLTQGHQQAANEYNRIRDDTNIGGYINKTWFFRMYGKEPGQSFHEQQVESEGFSNPLTLRVRRDNAVLVETTKSRLTGILATLSAQHVPLGAARAVLDPLIVTSQDTFADMKDTLDNALQEGSDAALTEASRTVSASYRTWLADEFVPQMGKALHATKRGLSDTALPTTLAQLRQQAADAEAASRMGQAVDWVRRWYAVERLLSLNAIRSAIRQLPERIA